VIAAVVMDERACDRVCDCEEGFVEWEFEEETSGVRARSERWIAMRLSEGGILAIVSILEWRRIENL
jgi:hypothetical protein